VLADSPSTGLEPVNLFSSWSEFPSVGKHHTYYLTYFGRHQPAQVEVHVPEGEQYRGEVIDTWDMTATAVEEAIMDGSVVQLPGTPNQALLMRRI
jgi:hypothetical protein